MPQLAPNPKNARDKASLEQRRGSDGSVCLLSKLYSRFWHLPQNFRGIIKRSVTISLVLSQLRHLLQPSLPFNRTSQKREGKASSQRKQAVNRENKRDPMFTKTSGRWHKHFQSKAGWLGTFPLALPSCLPPTQYEMFSFCGYNLFSLGMTCPRLDLNQGCLL